MIIENITIAASEIFTLGTIFLMTLGVVAGLIAGAIPGFTIAMAVVLVLPFTFGMNPVQGLATMIGVYVGGLSGGLMAGILTGIPGTPSSVATTFDGFPLARKGQPGLALGVGVWASFFGGVISAAVLVLVAPQLARIGQEFQPWDYFALMMFALTVTASLAGDNMVKGLIAGLIGLFVATIGEDAVVGVPRFTFGVDSVQQGFAFLPVLIGLFAFTRLLSDVQDRQKAQQNLGASSAEAVRLEHMKAAREVLSRWVNLVRSSLIGVFIGVLPAAGSSISNILAYDQAKKNSKEADKFGTGHIDGIIAPEAANNATAGGALIVMMALGIPGDIITAVMLGALLIHDVVPSPTFITDEPVIAYSIFIAFFVANFLMLAMQSLTLRGFVAVTRVRMYMLASVILFYCALGVFALNNVQFDMWTLLWFGIGGFVMRMFGFPIVPVILGVVLGNIAENALAQVIALSNDPTPFVTRPWSLFFIVLGLFSSFFHIYQKRRGLSRWTLAFIPAMYLTLSIPVFMMEGTVRPVLGVGLGLFGLYLLFRRHRSGWVIDGPKERIATGGLEG
ncbi:MAG: Tat pathway signal protein [Rhodospirillaceae bacterium]|jgi:putative tricarboxylic transport membrane protein|nr:Tat pathway signal protein [Rhodospirillaceae bacterium]MBT3494417.1 Tat pathway signal protein [Rhodospirillaceae bacterium]MBT3781322.1 Tat pathway signal protein [Rhodospirillaceae bacterium]MBT3978757.1 Tat pathway signal protein [Rhodospirillaceae bacterium]MBT4167036.1 Tat pathway signal protein [Rhodospirillaceae bacterium]